MLCTKFRCKNYQWVEEPEERVHSVKKPICKKRTCKKMPRVGGAGGERALCKKPTCKKMEAGGGGGGGRESVLCEREYLYYKPVKDWFTFVVNKFFICLSMCICSCEMSS